MGKPIEVKTADGSMLSFMATQSGDIAVEMRVPNFAASVFVPLFRSDPLSSYFGDIAAHWRGWKGEKCWNDLEERCTLMATHDGRGHVTLTIGVTDISFEQSAKLQVVLEAGQLDSFAIRLKNNGL